MIVEQGPIALAVGAGGGCLDIISLISIFSLSCLPLWETARYRLKYCLKGLLNPKHPTDQPSTNILPLAFGLVLFETGLFSQIFGAKVLDKLSVPGRPTNLDDSRARACCACSRCGWGLF